MSQRVVASIGKPRPDAVVFIARGRIARMGGEPQAANPYEQGSAEAILWLYGWGQGKLQAKPLRRRARDVSRETRRETKRTRKPPYSEPERDVIRLCWGRLDKSVIAAILGRSKKSIANEAWRLGLGKAGAR